VIVRGVGLELIAAVLKEPSASVVPLSAKENDWGTLAVTLIWLFVTVGRAYVPESIRVGPAAYTPIVPLLLILAEAAVLTAELLDQLKQ
jgi:hypothetical protein